MPLYPYECKSCGGTADIIQPMGESPRRKCLACGKLSLRRLFGVPNAVVRGSPKCVGQLAEDNTRTLVREHGRERAAEIIREKTYGRNGKRLKLPKGAKAVPRPTEVEVPWFRSGEVPGTGPRLEAPLDVTSVKNPVKYARTGDKE